MRPAGNTSILFASTTESKRAGRGAGPFALVGALRRPVTRILIGAARGDAYLARTASPRRIRSRGAAPGAGGRSPEGQG
jgi:hypothetical protein